MGESIPFPGAPRRTAALARTGDVQQVSLGVVDILKICVIGHRLNALLGRNHFIVTGHHDDRPELKSLGQVHRAD